MTQHEAPEQVNEGWVFFTSADTEASTKWSTCELQSVAAPAVACILPCYAVCQQQEAWQRSLRRCPGAAPAWPASQSEHNRQHQDNLHQQNLVCVEKTELQSETAEFAASFWLPEGISS